MTTISNWSLRHSSWSGPQGSLNKWAGSRELNQFSGAKVVVVDDDPVQRLMARDALEVAGFIVVEATDGPEGIALSYSERPDLIILDLMMPKLDGFSVCSEIRRIKETHTIPILVVTGIDDPTAIQRAFDMGASDFDLKPVVWNLLGLRVQYFT